MLILKRRKDQAVVLNNIITVYVLDVEGSVVKLGFDAPESVVILRQELLDEAGNAPDTPKGVEGE